MVFVRNVTGSFTLSSLMMIRKLIEPKAPVNAAIISQEVK